MNKSVRLSGFFVVLSFLLSVLMACADSQMSDSQVTELPRLQQEAVLSLPLPSAHVFGGISGIDYLPEENTFFLVSDDRAERGPARIYEVRFDEQLQISAAETIFLQKVGGGSFESGQVDPESVRYHPDGYLVWSSEKGPDKPGVYLTDLATGKTEEFPLPEYIYPSTEASSGARENKFIEGIALTPDARFVLFALEAPLVQDGDLPDYQQGAQTRILMFEISSRNLIAEYMYSVDPIYHQPLAEPEHADNGVSEILMLDGQHLLVLERSGWHIGDGDFAFDNRIYVVNLELSLDASSGEINKRLLDKNLFLSVRDYLGDRQENLEGMSFGSSDSQGRLLYLVSDNNFHVNHQTQLLEFLISP